MTMYFCAYCNTSPCRDDCTRNDPPTLVCDSVQQDKWEGLDSWTISVDAEKKPHEFDTNFLHDALRCRICGKIVTAQEVEDAGGILTLAFDCAEAWAR